MIEIFLTLQMAFIDTHRRTHLNTHLHTPPHTKQTHITQSGNKFFYFRLSKEVGATDALHTVTIIPSTCYRMWH